jgi:hypothetical protein
MRFRLIQLCCTVSRVCFIISQKFFQPAVDNIRHNLGPSSVSEEHVRDVCRQILEDAKQMYCSSSQSRGSSPFNELSDSETGSIGEYRFGRPNTHVSWCTYVFKQSVNCKCSYTLCLFFADLGWPGVPFTMM